jgi:hypothetical protein
LSRLRFVDLEIRALKGETQEAADLLLVIDDKSGAG